MILEVIRMVTDALNNPTYGVNAKLVALDLDAGDSTPDDVALITDETVNGQVAAGLLPSTTPCLAVNLSGPVEYDGGVMTTVRDAEVTVVIRLALSEAELEDGCRNAYYTMRAVQQTIKELNSNQNSADAVRNGIQLLRCVRMRQVESYAPIEDAIEVAALEITWEVRDTNP